MGDIFLLRDPIIPIYRMHTIQYFRMRLVGWFILLNITFNNSSVISWQSVLLVEETGVPRENHQQTLSHNVVSSTPRLEQGSNSQL